MTEMEGFFGPVISTYTRADAIRDGVLVEVPTEVAREVGFLLPVALTRAVWRDCVEWTDDAEARRGVIGQDEEGRLWDVLFLARSAARRNPSGSLVSFTLRRVPQEGRGRLPRPVRLLLAAGPGDRGEQVLTVMFPGED